MDVKITEVDNNYIHINTDRGIGYELYDHFSFRSPNANFDPRVRNGMWDGMIHLFSTMTGRIYRGLLHEVVKFCKERGYSYTVSGIDEINLLNIHGDSADIKELEKNITFREYQKPALVELINKRRSICILPTGAGKTSLIYGLAAYHANQHEKVLLVVINVQLLHQTADKLVEYGMNREDITITGDGDKNKSGKVVIATWQTIHKFGPRWFEDFDVLIGDEIHQFQSKSLIKVMTQASNAKYRYGFTATLSNNSQSSDMTLVGLFGSVLRPTSTKELADKGYLAKVNLIGITMKHSLRWAKELKEVLATKKAKGPALAKWIYKNPERNQYIAKLASSLKGNVLVLFVNVEHGILLKDLLKNVHGRDAYVISGKVDSKKKKEYTKNFDQGDNGIMLATFGVFQAGIDIVNVNHLIMASPVASEIRTLQSMGRGLRVGEGKDQLQFIDLVDLLPNTNNQVFIRRFQSRWKFYKNEGYKVKFVEVNI